MTVAAQPETDRQAVAPVEPLRPSTSRSVPRKARSRLIKTNSDDDVKTPYLVVEQFKKWLEQRELMTISIHGKNKATGQNVTFTKSNMNRWTLAYFKKRLARLYKLREWFDNQQFNEVSMVTLTVPHNENVWGKRVNHGHNIWQAWENLKQGWNRIRDCSVLRDKEFVIIYEPHKSGYPHIHLMVFGSFVDSEVRHLKELWSDMTGANIEDGVKISPGIGVQYLIAYLIKYMSKTLYHTKDSWTRGEWLFNAIAHEKHYRLFGASNNLSKIMRLVTDKDDDIEWLDTSLNGLEPRYEDDTVCTSRLWTKSGIDNKLNNPILRHVNVAPTSVKVAEWKLRNGIPESEAEIIFSAKQKAWRKWEADRAKRVR